MINNNLMVSDKELAVINNEGRQTVSGRMLHQFLEVETHYTLWMERLIKKYEFVAGNDFEEYTFLNSQNKPVFDNQLTLSTAKEISMVSNTEKGKQARKYFIACEEKLKQVQLPSYMIEDEEKRAITWAAERRQARLQLESVTVERDIALDTVNILTHVDKLYNTTEIAKELGLKSANALNKYLSEKGLQYKSNNTWVLYSKYSDLEYVSIKQRQLDNGKVIYDRKWTQRGREYLLNLISTNLIRLSNTSKNSTTLRVV